MQKKKSKSKLRLKIFFAFEFCCIIAGFIFYAEYVDSFNKEERTYIASEEKSAFFSVYPRGGTSDTWTKNIRFSRDRQFYCTGRVYEMRIRNNTEYTINDWNMKVDIDCDCFLANAWCGTVEVHQFVDGFENVQELDLRNFVAKKIKLDYKIEGSDLFIPLQAGDYFIYHPSIEVNEYPVISLEATESDVTCGMIIYTPTNSSLNISKIALKYYLQKDLWQGSTFKLLVLILFLWWMAVVTASAVQISISINNKRLAEKEEIIKQTMMCFANIYDSKNEQLIGHSQRVAQYAVLLAEKMGLSEEKCKDMYYIGLMHDCGKIYLPAKLLSKREGLTEEEYKTIKDHTIKGAEILKDFKAIKGIGNAALYHHERYDGGGYPSGKKGDVIPLEARIICLVDAFDLLNSRSKYKSDYSKEFTLNEIANNRGRQFDPSMVDKFLELIEEGKITLD